MIKKTWMAIYVNTVVTAVCFHLFNFNKTKGTLVTERGPAGR